MLSFFPRDVFDEIWDIIESVSEGFPTYSCNVMMGRKSGVFTRPLEKSDKDQILQQPSSGLSQGQFQGHFNVESSDETLRVIFKVYDATASGQLP